VCVYLPGSISQDELKGVMKKLGSNPTDDDIQQMIKSVDDNGDGEIDFDEFLILMSTKKKNEDPDKELMDAFKVFDADGSGTISRKELKKLMKQLGQKLSDQELDAMMEEVDTDKSGEIDFEEFKAMMQN
jgi:Ca2+-binding EF-hand superfamily protein